MDSSTQSGSSGQQNKTTDKGKGKEKMKWDEMGAEQRAGVGSDRGEQRQFQGPDSATWSNAAKNNTAQNSTSQENTAQNTASQPNPPLNFNNTTHMTPEQHREYLGLYAENIALNHHREELGKRRQHWAWVGESEEKREAMQQIGIEEERNRNVRIDLTHRLVAFLRRSEMEVGGFGEVRGGGRGEGGRSGGMRGGRGRGGMEIREFAGLDRNMGWGVPTFTGSSGGTNGVVSNLGLISMSGGMGVGSSMNADGNQGYERGGVQDQGQNGGGGGVVWGHGDRGNKS